MHKARHGHPRERTPRVASLLGLCVLAIVLASCGASNTPTVGPTSTGSLAASPKPSPAASHTASGTPPITSSPSAGGPSPSPASAFTLLKMATAADPSKPVPDSTKYTDTFPTSAPAVYVVFSLRPGLTGKVVCTMSRGGKNLLQPLTLTYAASNSWGDFKIRPQAKFAAGAYQAMLTFSGTGETAKIDFTVK